MTVTSAHVSIQKNVDRPFKRSVTDHGSLLSKTTPKKNLLSDCSGDPFIDEIFFDLHARWKCPFFPHFLQIVSFAGPRAEGRSLLCNDRWRCPACMPHTVIQWYNLLHLKPHPIWPSHFLFASYMPVFDVSPPNGSSWADPDIHSPWAVNLVLTEEYYICCRCECRLESSLSYIQWPFNVIQGDHYYR